MKYNIILANNTEVLVEKVNKAIEEGWYPAAGVAVCTWQGSNMYAQAIIKED